MVTITLPDRAPEKPAPGCASGQGLKTGARIVPEAAPAHLADQNSPFTMKGATCN
ncbi:hypothetical protein R5W24_004751 [Gemmata sp. JC717]|uniref:hypothetical protein n=1 Tax=Gemmata algarum TaxID=2975278 RepID=UPI0021BBB25E|nr:hypothetical protein [Gemmata algarum]MDY3555606.1 hypothetical protein [Gemmata algarum]